MIYNVKGTLTVTGQSFAVVNCGGVGFQCHTTLTTLKTLDPVGSEVNLFTYLNVREDAMDLYGFLSLEELDCFKLLVSVSGIGPKAALAILSELTPDKLAVCIATGDAKALTKAQGVGKKIAERAVLELKDKVQSIVTDQSASHAVAAAAQAAERTGSTEAVEALVALGFSQSEASVAIAQLAPGLTVDEMIRHGLKFLSRQV